ncbi:NAD(P)-dependent oxidoreductase [Streptomyces sp. N2-109]|uniref:NAD(P)-dependent oxidoreductase n=1 Tax=Streptomyces gossypii TaxID=2883101 RepID=A0ABT2JT87_9ACTN|nr:NAD(P)-dependent oxidoreductase [Streptomyces gossypii]
MPPDLAGVRIAVTGASGFCGTHIAVAAAAAGAEVVCLGRRPGPVGRQLRWDAARTVPALGAADLVVHCAAAVGDPVGAAAEAAMRAVNVDGTARLLEAAGGRPLVWISSASVYDPRVDRRTVREGHPVAGQLNAYGRTKAAGERLALAAGAVVLRPRAVYGPGDPHLVPRLLARVRAGALLLPGPDVELSLTAVENLTDAALAAGGWPAGAYNIADGSPYRRDSAVRAVLRAHGSRARVGHLPRPFAMAAARAAEAYARRGAWGGGRGEPALSRYAVDQLAHPVVLDVSKARARGWVPRRTLAAHLATLAGGAASEGAQTARDAHH